LTVAGGGSGVSFCSFCNRRGGKKPRHVAQNSATRGAHPDSTKLRNPGSARPQVALSTKDTPGEWTGFRSFPLPCATRRYRRLVDFVIPKPLKCASMARPVKDPDIGAKTERVLSRATCRRRRWSGLSALPQRWQGVSLSEFVRGTAVSASASYVPERRRSRREVDPHKDENAPRYGAESVLQTLRRYRRPVSQARPPSPV
jgi:hypothetical protein